MILSGWFLLGIYVVFLLCSAGMYWDFVRTLKHRAAAPAGFTPKVAVLFPLRGDDPMLEHSLRGICTQEYTNMRVFVLLDSAEDSAMETIQRILAEFPNAPVEVEVVEPLYDSCSLKCNNLVQKVRQLDESYEIIATLDGDVIPHPHWVQEMVAPFGNADVNFVTGYRWFVPTGSLGSLVRYTWNLAACVQVHLNGILWGGSSAIRRSAIEQCHVCDYWKRSLAEDVASTECTRNHHQKAVFVASNLMACREECSLRFAFRWCSRQMLMVRLGSPAIWHRICGLAGLITFLHVASFFLIGKSLQTGDSPLLAVSLTGMLLFWFGTLLFIPLLESFARRNIQKYQPAVRWKGIIPLQLIFSLPFTMLCFCTGMVYAKATRIISWRGIQYQIDRKRQVQRINYAPYLPEKSSSQSIW